MVPSLARGDFWRGRATFDPSLRLTTVCTNNTRAQAESVAAMRMFEAHVAFLLQLLQDMFDRVHEGVRLCAAQLVMRSWRTLIIR